MAEEVVSLRASGGHLSVTRLLSLASSLPVWIHCQASHKHCLNYISKVLEVTGMKRERDVGVKWVNGGSKKKRKEEKEQVPVRKKKNGFWTAE